MNILDPSKFVARGPNGERLTIRDGKWAGDTVSAVNANGERLVVRNGQWVPAH